MDHQNTFTQDLSWKAPKKLSFPKQALAWQITQPIKPNQLLKYSQQTIGMNSHLVHGKGKSQ